MSSTNSSTTINGLSVLAFCNATKQWGLFHYQSKQFYPINAEKSGLDTAELTANSASLFLHEQAEAPGYACSCAQYSSVDIEEGQAVNWQGND